MRRALDLAALGLGKVSPNPMVGCVIAFEGKIVGEGWHKKYGGSHAEVNAINAVKEKTILPKSTLYVNLEPCAHHGKTPPCVDLIIASGIKTVVVSNTDPNPLVAGKGIETLRAAGIEVIEHISEDLGCFLNRRFFTFYQKQRPYIILKWAQTKDGFVARSNFDSKWISNEQSRRLVHRYRASEDSIMVGANTAKYDNPELTVRLWQGDNPIRIVLDPSLRLSRDLKLFDGTVNTLCFNYIKEEQNEGFQLIKCPKDRFLDSVWDHLRERNVHSVLVEGGSKLLNSLISAEQWDEARVFTSNQEFGAGIEAPVLTVHPYEERSIAGDLLKTYFKINASN